jgi:anthranilate phosphoribosyltransferase
MKLLIEGQATQAQIGAFLMAMRFKMESVSELAAFTAAARAYVAPLSIPKELAVVDVPSYAGKSETFHSLIAGAIVAASAGAAIVMHGYDGIPGRPGAAGVLKALGIPIDLDPKMAGEEVTKKGFVYLDIGMYHPPLYRFLEMRQEIGVRNLFHPIARLLNPSRAAAQVVGLSHPPHFEKTAEVLRMLGCPRALVIRGVEGYWSCGMSGSLRWGFRRRISVWLLVPLATWPGSPRASRIRKRSCCGGSFRIRFRAVRKIGY